MAWIVKLLEAASSTVDLNDGAATYLHDSGFSAPPPPSRTSMSGGNLSRHGADLMAHAYDNRSVTVRFQMKGANATALTQKVQDIWAILRKAREYARDGVGTQVQLQYQWDGAASPVYFNVINGELDLGADLHTPYLSQGTRIRNAQLTLLCEPFAVGTAETLENYVRDPSFEVAGTALADYTTAGVATGTSTRSTEQVKFGAAALKQVMTDSTGTYDFIRMSQNIAATAGEVWSFGVWAKYTSRSNSYVNLGILWLDTTLGAIRQDTAPSISTTCDWTLTTTSNLTAPADTVWANVFVNLVALGANCTGTCYWDGITAVKAATLPTAFVSGREVQNHNDDAGQLHVNYVDIYNLQGDVTAPAQIKVTENEAHTEVWLGARHAGRVTDAGIFHEGEDFGTVTAVAVADASKGTVGRINHGIVWGGNWSGTGLATSTIQINATALGYSKGMLAVVGVCDATAGAPSTVTYQGTAMTLIGSVTSGTLRLNAYDLHGTGLGSGTIFASFTGAASAIGMIGLSYYDIGTPILSGSGTSNGTMGTVDAPTGTNRDMRFGILLSAGTTQGTVQGTGGTLTERGGMVLGSATKFAFLDTVQMDSISTATGSFAWGSIDNQPWLTMGILFKPAYSTSTPRVVTKAIGTPPVGVYRAIARARSDGRTYGLGMGYSYGALTQTPASGTDYVTLDTTATTYRMVDLGILTIPPIDTPAGGTIGTYTLRLASHVSSGNTAGSLFIDYVALVPIDQGFVYVNKASTIDVVMADSKSAMQAVYLVNGSGVVQSVPANQVGQPPELHPGGSRIYYLTVGGTADISNGGKVSITYTPRFLNVD